MYTNEVTFTRVKMITTKNQQSDPDGQNWHKIQYHYIQPSGAPRQGNETRAQKCPTLIKPICLTNKVSNNSINDKLCDSIRHSPKSDVQSNTIRWYEDEDTLIRLRTVMHNTWGLARRFARTIISGQFGI